MEPIKKKLKLSGEMKEIAMPKMFDVKIRRNGQEGSIPIRARNEDEARLLAMNHTGCKYKDIIHCKPSNPQ